MSEIDYPRLLREATTGIVRGLLARVAQDGLPGEHHFYLSFRTTDPGVELAPGLASRYPETMTIVLQRQWADLAVDDEGFAVTLRFGGIWERLRVPFAALTSFLDPSVPFGLDFTQFAVADGVVETSDGVDPADPAPTPAADDSAEDGSPDAPAEAVKPADVLPFRPR